MKLSLLPLYLVCMPLVAVAQDGVAAIPLKEAEPKELTANQKAFLNLPEEKRKQFVELVADSERLFGEKRVFETIEKLDKAGEIFKDSPELLNMRGSCYVEFRAFDKAMACFREAEKLSPNNPSVAFNIGEVLFVTKKWKECHEAFEKGIKLLDPQRDMALSRLVEFKILLCKLRLNQAAEAETLAEKYDYLDDSPYYYYAQAALAYEKKDTVKAEEWLARAGRIFQSTAILAPWQDTMVEYGYVKSFYGDDLTEAQ